MSSGAATRMFQWNGTNQTISGGKLLSVCARIRTVIPPLVNKQGVHTVGYLFAAGFEYTGNGDTARCNTCGLEVSGWTKDMNPFDIHSEHSPHCQFIRSIKRTSTTTSFRNTLTFDGRQDLGKRQKIETNDFDVPTNTSIEADRIQEARQRTFSHRSHCESICNKQMIEAGFFNCNIDDRVVCLYCNLICDKWIPNSYKPGEVHRTLSPTCPYVIANLINDTPPSILNPAQSSTNSASVSLSERLRPLQQKKNKRKIQKPITTSFSTSFDNTPSINDVIIGALLDADFKSIKECIYCKKALQNMDDDSDPMKKKAHYLVHSVHNESDDEDELYHKSEGPRRNHPRSHNSNQAINSGIESRKTSKLSLCDKRILSRLFRAGFNLPISARLLNKELKLINENLIIGLQITEIDSISEIDLLLACIIIQKQIDHIDGKAENIIMPSERMSQIYQQNTIEATEDLKRRRANSNITIDGISLEPCVVCLAEDKQLASLPCGHVITCVPCGHALRLCPLCRQGIAALVRIYV